MISSQQKEVLRVLDLVAEQQADRFDGLFSTVDVIAKEKVVGLWWEPTVLKDSQQVVVLTVHITCKRTKILKSDDRHTCQSLIVTWIAHVGSSFRKSNGLKHET